MMKFEFLTAKLAGLNKSYVTIRTGEIAAFRSKWVTEPDRLVRLSGWEK